MNDYYRVLKEIGNDPSLEGINKFDKITSIINQRITKELSTLTRFIPHINGFVIGFKIGLLIFGY